MSLAALLIFSQAVTVPVLLNDTGVDNIPIKPTEVLVPVQVGDENEEMLQQIIQTKLVQIKKRLDNLSVDLKLDLKFDKVDAVLEQRIEEVDDEIWQGYIDMSERIDELDLCLYETRTRHDKELSEFREYFDFMTWEMQRIDDLETIQIQMQIQFDEHAVVTHQDDKERLDALDQRLEAFLNIENAAGGDHAEELGINERFRFLEKQVMFNSASIKKMQKELHDVSYELETTTYRVGKMEEFVENTKNIRSTWLSMQQKLDQDKYF